MRKATSKRRMRTKTRRSGVSVGLARVLIRVCVLLGVAAIAVFPAAAGKRDKQEPFALIAGTVFRDTGFALPGAEVSLKPTPEGPSAVKVKNAKMVSTPRGEFVFRVPAAPMRYTVSVKARGFREQTKPVSITGDERVDVFFRLEAESK